MWEAKAAKLARQVNCGWWVQAWMQIAVPSCLVLACGILLFRSQGSELALSAAALRVAVGALVVIVSLVAWLVARRNFISREVALVRLEAKLELEGALSSALAGVGAWPAIAAEGGAGAAGFRWRLARVVLPGLLAVLVLGGSLMVPLGSTAELTAATEEPAAWGQMEDWLETLEEEEVVDPHSVDEVRARIEQLRDHPEEEWFSHSSLEAGDSLKQALGQSIESMGQGLEMAEQTLAALESAGGGAATEGLREQLAQQYQETTSRLQASSLKLDPELLAQLAKLDPSQLQQLDPEALKELRERLRKASGT